MKLYSSERQSSLPGAFQSESTIHTDTNLPFTIMTAEVSHGRGGAGNIDVDDTKYVDGEVVRSGDVGSHGDGAFSAGRGGASSIAD